jgi:hypothetical protein
MEIVLIAQKVQNGMEKPAHINHLKLLLQPPQLKMLNKTTKQETMLNLHLLQPLQNQVETIKPPQPSPNTDI